MVKLFISYSHRDHHHRKKLEAALSGMYREALIAPWSDRMIRPGEDWALQIDRNLEEADIILLLVSPDFVASDYCYGKEMDRALERHAIGSAVAVPVILRPTDWLRSRLSGLQALPSEGKPIAQWRNRDAAWLDVVRGIRSLAEARLDSRPAIRKRLQLFPRMRNRYYTGRDKTLSLIRRRFRQGDGPRIQVLSGLGGNGKTETALEYAYCNRDHYEVILWFRSETEAELRNDMQVCARALGVAAAAGTNTDAAVAACRSWLESNTRWLAIFDNADDLSRVAAYLPATIGGDVLVTSRSDDADALPGAEVTAVVPFPVTVAAAFLLKRANAAGPEEAAAASALAGELGGLPLALEQAGAYVAALKTTIVDYLASFRSTRLNLLEESGPVTGDPRTTVITTWTMNFDEVRSTSPAAADLLRACAFMVPDRIPTEVFTKGAACLSPEIARALIGAAADPLALPRLLRPLRRYSLITFDRGTNSITIHRLVQEVLRSALNDDERRLWYRRSMEVVVAAFPIERLSPADSVVHVSHALATCQALGDGDRGLELALLTLLGPALIAANGYASDRVGEVYRRASALLRRSDSPLMRFRTLWGLWAFNYVSGRLAEARGLAERLEHSARAAPARAGRSGYLLEALRASASTTFTLGDVGRARERFREALRLYDPACHAHHAHGFAVEPSIVCWSYLTVCDLLVRGVVQGLKTCDALMGRAASQPHLFSRVYACYWASCSHQLRGDVERARQAAEDGLGLSRQQFPQWDAMNEIIRAWCIARLEDPSRGVELLEAGLEKHERTGALTIRPYFLMLLAEARLIRGTSDAARQTLDLALAAAARTHEHTWTPLILQRRAEFGPRPLATRMLHRATKMVSRQGTIGFRLAPLVGLDRATEGA